MQMTMTRVLALLAAIAFLGALPVFALANNGDESNEHKSTFRTETLVLLREDGTALVRGAEVTDISDSTVTAETDLDGVLLTWRIDVADAEFITLRGDDDFDLSDLDEGDTVSFSGELTGAFSVDADVIKEWSLPQEKPEISAKVKGWFNKHFNFGWWKNH